MCDRLDFRATGQDTFSSSESQIEEEEERGADLVIRVCSHQKTGFVILVVKTNHSSPVSLGSPSLKSSKSQSQMEVHLSCR